MTIYSPTDRHLPALRMLWKEAFSDTDAFLDLFFETAFSKKRCRCVFDGDTPVSVLYFFDCSLRREKVAYIYAVATLKDYRGRGLSSALLKDTHSYLSENGYTGALLVPGERELFSFYERLGYRTATTVTEFSATEKGSIPLVKIDANKYRSLRRDFLPKDSVIQEGENLKFLSAQSEFYTGDGILLAARREKNKLICTEFLGNADSAPSILGTLGCTEGYFRTPGKDRDFAMFVPLREGIAPPAYFGLAFD